MAAYKARQAKLNARNAFDLVQFAKRDILLITCTRFMFKIGNKLVQHN